jgi:hypothetical protein
VGEAKKRLEDSEKRDVANGMREFEDFSSQKGRYGLGITMLRMLCTARSYAA